MDSIVLCLDDRRVNRSDLVETQLPFLPYQRYPLPLRSLTAKIRAPLPPRAPARLRPRTATTASCSPPRRTTRRDRRARSLLWRATRRNRGRGRQTRLGGNGGMALPPRGGRLVCESRRRQTRTPRRLPMAPAVRRSHSWHSTSLGAGPSSR